MVDVYQRAKREAGYQATYFIQMVSDRGGLATARYLLHASGVSEGFTALWERRRLDLTVEAVVLQERFAPLFSDEERRIARARLREYGYETG
jgi:nucleotidyltransferase/DNA polymerase involved in DNA repair